MAGSCRWLGARGGAGTAARWRDGGGRLERTGQAGTHDVVVWERGGLRSGEVPGSPEVSCVPLLQPVREALLAEETQQGQHDLG